MWRSLLAVLGAWAVIQLLVSGADEGLVRLARLQSGAGLRPPGWVMAVRLAWGALCTVLGGWLAARLAPERPWRHAAYLILLGITLGVLSAGPSLGQVQWWYLAGMLLLFPPAVLAGAWLWLRGRGTDGAAGR